MRIMHQIKTVALGLLIPNDSYVYRENLARAMQRWDDGSFQNGSLVKTIKVDDGYYVPDGNHRVYVAMFYHGHDEAKVTIITPDLFEPNHQELSSYRANIRRIREDGVNDFLDLYGRIKQGSWQAELSRQKREKRAMEQWGLPLHEAISLGLMREVTL